MFSVFGIDPITYNFNFLLQNFSPATQQHFLGRQCFLKGKWACLEYSFQFVLRAVRFGLQTADRGFVLCERHLHLYIIALLVTQSIPTIGPLRFQQRVIHIERASASSFNFQYKFILKASGSCLRLLLPHFLVTSILPSIFSSVMF
jgi:hypothetical protein